MATGIPAPHHARLPLNGAMTPMNIVLFGTLAEVIKFVVDNSRRPKGKDSFILSACSCYYCCRSCCFLMKNLFLRLMHAVLFVPLSRPLPDFSPTFSFSLPQSSKQRGMPRLSGTSMMTDQSRYFTRRKQHQNRNNDCNVLFYVGVNTSLTLVVFPLPCKKGRETRN